MYKVYCQHTHYDTNPPIVCKTYDECVNIIHEHFLSYGFELCDGLAIDPLEEDGSKETFSNVIISRGRVASFKHYDKEGPIGMITGGIFEKNYDCDYSLSDMTAPLIIARASDNDALSRIELARAEALMRAQIQSARVVSINNLARFGY